LFSEIKWQLWKKLASFVTNLEMGKDEWVDSISDSKGSLDYFGFRFSISSNVVLGDCWMLILCLLVFVWYFLWFLLSFWLTLIICCWTEVDFFYLLVFWCWVLFFSYALLISTWFLCFVILLSVIGLVSSYCMSDLFE
jgi:hypothetical protein